MLDRGQRVMTPTGWVMLVGIRGVWMMERQSRGGATGRLFYNQPQWWLPLVIAFVQIINKTIAP